MKLVINRIFFNYNNPRYFPRWYRFAKKYVAFYQGDENGDRNTNGGWRWLDEYMSKKRPKVIFDVGGYDAEYALRILRIDPTVHLHVFEPNPETFVKKTVPILTGKGDHVYLVNEGLSDSVKKAVLFTNTQRGATDSLHQVTDGKYFHTGKVEVSLSTVDEYVRQKHIDHIDLLKLDTEGNDYHVLLGAQQTLAAGRIDTIVFEFSLHYTYSRIYFRDFADFLGKFGYRIYKIMPKNLTLVTHPEMERSLYAYFVAMK